MQMMQQRSGGQADQFGPPEAHTLHTNGRPPPGPTPLALSFSSSFSFSCGPRQPLAAACLLPAKADLDARAGRSTRAGQPMVGKIALLLTYSAPTLRPPDTQNERVEYNKFARARSFAP